MEEVVVVDLMIRKTRALLTLEDLVLVGEEELVSLLVLAV